MQPHFAKKNFSPEMPWSIAKLCLTRWRRRRSGDTESPPAWAQNMKKRMTPGYTANRFSSLKSSSTFSGFAIWPSMPAFKDFSRSSSKALAE